MDLLRLPLTLCKLLVLLVKQLFLLIYLVEVDLLQVSLTIGLVLGLSLISSSKVTALSLGDFSRDCRLRYGERRLHIDTVASLELSQVYDCLI